MGFYRCLAICECIPLYNRHVSSTKRICPDLSLVVPCYREEANLIDLHAAVESALGQDLDWELVLVDDGSPDKTLHVAEGLAKRDQRVKVIGFSRNFGKEAAMLAGLEYSSGQRVVIMDGDLQHPPSLIPEMLQKMDEEDADQVIARRDRAGDPAVRTGLSRLYYRFVNSMMDVQLADGAGDFRVLSRRAVRAILSMPEAQRFSKGLFSWIGFPTAEITYRNVQREGGESSWSTRKLFNYAIDSVLSFNSRPLRAVIWLGGGVFSLGVLYFIYLFVSWLISGVSAPGYITTIAAIIAFGGVQLASIGIVGEYVGRIYTEVKRRPHYIVATEENVCR